MTILHRSRRSFLKTSVALAGTTPLISGLLQAQSSEASGPLIAYVGTFSSPLGDVLPTQVDLPPGNGRGIHLFKVNRTTGSMTPTGIHEMVTSPSCLALNTTGTRLYSANETASVGKDKKGTISAFSVDRADGHLTLLNTVRSGGAGPTYLSIHPSGRFMLVANYFGGSVAVSMVWMASCQNFRHRFWRLEAIFGGPAQTSSARPRLRRPLVSTRATATRHK